MYGLIDLHCHWLPGVDDGVETLEDSVVLLRGLFQLGFVHVVATPHMRPGLFDTTAEQLREAYCSTREHHRKQAGLPELSLSCEHYFDDVVFNRLCEGQGLPYAGGHAVLLEFYQNRLPASVDRLLAKLKRLGLTPVIAHPERYQALWESPSRLERLLDLGAVALLDIAAVVGKYGRKPQQTAELLLEQGLYYAACSDAHHPRDLQAVEAGIAWLDRHYGKDDVYSLFREGPAEILGGTTEL